MVVEMTAMVRVMAIAMVCGVMLKCEEGKSVDPTLNLTF